MGVFETVRKALRKIAGVFSKSTPAKGEGSGNDLLSNYNVSAANVTPTEQAVTTIKQTTKPLVTTVLPTTKSEDGTSLWIIAGAIGGAVLLIIVLVVIFFCVVTRRRRTRSRNLRTRAVNRRSGLASMDMSADDQQVPCHTWGNPTYGGQVDSDGRIISGVNTESSDLHSLDPAPHQGESWYNVPTSNRLIATVTPLPKTTPNVTIDEEEKISDDANSKSASLRQKEFVKSRDSGAFGSLQLPTDSSDINDPSVDFYKVPYPSPKPVKGKSKNKKEVGVIDTTVLPSKEQLGHMTYAVQKSQIDADNKFTQLSPTEPTKTSPVRNMDTVVPPPPCPCTPKYVNVPGAYGYVNVDDSIINTQTNEECNQRKLSIDNSYINCEEYKKCKAETKVKKSDLSNKKRNDRSKVQIKEHNAGQKQGTNRRQKAQSTPKSAKATSPYRKGSVPKLQVSTPKEDNSYENCQQLKKPKPNLNKKLKGWPISKSVSTPLISEPTSDDDMYLPMSSTQELSQDDEYVAMKSPDEDSFMYQNSDPLFDHKRYVNTQRVSCDDIYTYADPEAVKQLFADIPRRKSTDKSMQRLCTPAETTSRKRTTSENQTEQSHLLLPQKAPKPVKRAATFSPVDSLSHGPVRNQNFQDVATKFERN